MDPGELQALKVDVLRKLIRALEIERDLHLKEKLKRQQNKGQSSTGKKQKKEKNSKQQIKNHFYTSMKDFTNEYYDINEGLLQAQIADDFTPSQINILEMLFNPNVGDKITSKTVSSLVWRLFMHKNQQKI